MSKQLTLEELNPRVVAAKYAVRGPILERANRYAATLAAGGAEAEALPFRRVVKCNIGNPQALRQAPLSFLRQVLALCSYPALLEQPAAAACFPADALERARAFLREVPTGTGAYSHSKGVACVRRDVAAFVEARDGAAAGAVDPESVFLTNGASEGIRRVLQLVVRGPADGVMVPIPQYPLYSATVALLGGTLVGYELEERRGWALNLARLREQLAEAREAGTPVRALVVVNPGNPSGSVLSEEDLRGLVALARDEGLVLLADEVYQTNIYGARPFVSVRAAAHALGAAAGEVQIASFHSTSKGFVGECGRRGGYMQLQGFSPDAEAQLGKLASLSLCSNLDGQLMVSLMVRPPREGEPSHERYVAERDAILGSLKRRALALVEALNRLEGVSCQPASGALYAFPSITLPAAAIAAAGREGYAPDEYYCVRLLDRTGITVIPGSGFGQVDGTWHFRTTFLPPEDEMDSVMALLADAHATFMAEHK